jgi:chorismate mutase/prephenate dehydratase
VDRIDQRLLQLLQQRTKLSGEIGRTKRRHGAEIYVPGRERDLLARVAKLAGGKLPPPAVGAIFREILSSSRAAQGQAPIGVLQRNAVAIVPMARCHFGACDRFVALAAWPEMKRQLLAG